MLTKLDPGGKWNEIRTHLYKNPFKMYQKPYLKPETHRNLENLRNTHEDIGMGKDLLITMNTSSTGTDPSVNRWDNMKSKSFCPSKWTISRAHRHLKSRRESVSVTLWIGAHIYNLHTIMEMKYQGNRSANKQMGKWTERQISKTYTQMANKYCKKCLGSLKCHHRNTNYNYIEILHHSR